MSVIEGGAPNLIDRAKNILLQPKAEWDKIKGEQTGLQALITGYVLPLAALAAICGFIGMAFIGVPMPWGTIRIPIATAAGSAILQVVLACAWVWVLGQIINAIAPSFGSTQDTGQAYKVAAYSGTASLLAGVFAIFPPLAWLGLVGLYSLYLLWVGLPKLMNTPEDKKVGYFATVLVIAILGAIVLVIILSSVQRMGMPAGGVYAPY
ncbi:MAG: Yip1 family protein [Hyphomonadaceae bacterium]